jgi:hypothetical protein
MFGMMYDSASIVWNIIISFRIKIITRNQVTGYRQGKRLPFSLYGYTVQSKSYLSELAFGELEILITSFQTLKKFPDRIFIISFSE